MKKGFWGFAAGAMLGASLLAVPAGAQSVDDKIKALEQELTSLKSQQIELKKEATAAAAALPSFSYRPGNGVNIEAADKSWGLRFSIETNLRMIFSAGQDQVGRTNGEIMLRRWRLPFGIFTFLLGGMYVMVAPQHPTYGALLPLIIGMFLAGFLCDVLYRLVKPSYTELFKLRLFSFLMPVIVYSLYFASVGLFDGIGWTIHLVVGNIIISGLVGLAVALALTIAATPNLPTLQKP